MGRKVALAVLLVALATATYWGALDNPFVYDDLLAISGNLLIRKLQVAWVFIAGAPTSEGFASGQFRPLPMFSLALNYHWSGIAPWAYRCTNLILHVANCLLAALVLRRAVTAFPITKNGHVLDEREADWAAFLGSSFLAVHPIHSMVILLVWKRATLFACSFSLLAVWCLERLRGIGDANRPPAGKSSAWLVVGLYASHLLALSSKETAVVLPAMLLALDLWPRPGREPTAHPRARSMALFHAPLWLLSVAFFLFLCPHAARSAELSRLAYLAAQMKVVWLYAAMVVAPHLLSAAYAIHVPAGVELLPMVGGLGVLALLVTSLMLAKRAPLPTLCAAWAIVALVPTSTVFPIPLLVDEDRVYLSCVFPWALAGAIAMAGLRRGKAKARQGIVVGLVLALAFAAAFTVRRGALWSRPMLIWLDAKMRYPTSFQAVVNLCGSLAIEPSMARHALAGCGEAVKSYPDSEVAREGFVRVLATSGRTDQARAVLSEGLARQPESAKLLRLAGHLSWAQNQPQQAIDYYERSLRKLPLDSEIAIYLGSSYAQVGRKQEAVYLARQIAEWPEPEDMSSHLELLNLYHAIGWDERACAGYRALPSTVDASPEIASAAKLGLERACPH